ncbi:hypothetical protein CJ305_16905 [Leeuwenhoekiella nanhaiensis]|uniref:DUF2283 domain-containing protein n=2 Tax=Leeuwenhoekiella nanhaiensis TaxID=1655491 RepID=A0A2G1VMV1_9FLAO|nr:hypothetical protein CJ305_16905 [Leeuwenhoekiella nanhaiensis]
MIKEREPERTDLIKQLENSEIKEWFKQAYVRFVSGFKPNQSDSEWQFEECIELEHSSEGIIVLDILKDGRIGGIEFLNYIPHY